MGKKKRNNKKAPKADAANTEDKGNEEEVKIEEEELKNEETIEKNVIEESKIEGGIQDEGKINEGVAEINSEKTIEESHEQEKKQGNYEGINEKVKDNLGEIEKNEAESSIDVASEIRKTDEKEKIEEEAEGKNEGGIHFDSKIDGTGEKNYENSASAVGISIDESKSIDEEKPEVYQESVKIKENTLEGTPSLSNESENKEKSEILQVIGEKKSHEIEISEGNSEKNEESKKKTEIENKSEIATHEEPTNEEKHQSEIAESNKSLLDNLEPNPESKVIDPIAPTNIESHIEGQKTAIFKHFLKSQITSEKITHNEEVQPDPISRPEPTTSLEEKLEEPLHVLSEEGQATKIFSHFLKSKIEPSEKISQEPPYKIEELSSESEQKNKNFSTSLKSKPTQEPKEVPEIINEPKMHEEPNQKTKIFSHFLKSKIENSEKVLKDSDSSAAYEQKHVGAPLMDYYSIISEEKKSYSRKYECYFSIHYETKFGEKIFITGNTEELGNWDIEKAIELKWHEGHSWGILLQFSQIPFEYKYVCVSINETIWEKGKNRLFNQLMEETKDSWQPF